MSTQIYSKKTNAELIALTAEVASNKGQYDARVSAVDASLGEILAEIAGNKAEYDARVVAVDATISEFQSNYAGHLANFDAEKVLRDAQKADLEASIADARAEAGDAVADLDVKIDALAASSSGASSAVAGRVDALEAKVGADLTATINSALTDEVVKTTLDSFLAKDEELTAAVNGAVAERVNMDNAIKAKFDLLVSKLFEGLEFSGVTQAELSFGAPSPSSYTINFPDGSQQVVTSADEIDFTGFVMNGKATEKGVIDGDILYLLAPWKTVEQDGFGPQGVFWIKLRMATGEISKAILMGEKKWIPDTFTVELENDPSAWGASGLDILKINGTDYAGDDSTF